MMQPSHTTPLHPYYSLRYHSPPSAASVHSASNPRASTPTPSRNHSQTIRLTLCMSGRKTKATSAPTQLAKAVPEKILRVSASDPTPSRWLPNRFPRRSARAPIPTLPFP